MPSIIDPRSADRYTRMHECGGAILTGPHTDDGQQRYCDRCGAFCYGDDEDMPTGIDQAANQRAFDAGDLRSPEA